MSELKELGKAVLTVMGKVESVEKSTRNKEQGYNYASEADFLEALRPAMIESGLVLLPSVAGVTNRVKVSGAGKNLDMTRVDMSYTLLHVESGQSIELHSSGEGMDSGDKGLYKAITGANKYLLYKLFQVPTENDPEASSGPEPPARQPGAMTVQRQAPPPQPRPASSQQYAPTAGPLAPEFGAPCNLPWGQLHAYEVIGGEFKPTERGGFHKLKLALPGSDKYENITVWSQTAFATIRRVIGCTDGYQPWDYDRPQITLRLTRKPDREYQGKLYCNLEVAGEQDVLSDGGYAYDGVDPSELGPPLDMDELPMPEMSPGN